MHMVLTLGPCPVDKEDPCCVPTNKVPASLGRAAHATQVGKSCRRGRYLVVLRCLHNWHSQPHCWYLPVYFPFTEHARGGRLCKVHKAKQSCTWALCSFLLLPLQITSSSSCESSATMSDTSQERKSPLWGQKTEDIFFQKDRQKISILPIHQWAWSYFSTLH